MPSAEWYARDAERNRDPRVLPRRHLRTMKRTAGRPQHLVDLEQLPEVEG